jgi:hypothetical protein
MNPEFVRNVWLELTPRRMMMMAGLLALTFFAASLGGVMGWGPSGAASVFYYLIVVIWGARNASMGVVGEIRDRTWDMQRLSSLGAGTMTWGKLFGSTIYNWFGGALCLILVMVNIVTHLGPATAAIELVYYIGIGVIAQSSSLLASLIAIRRRQTHSRLDLFVYQAVGLCAAVIVYLVWSTADPVAAVLSHKSATDFIPWWSFKIDSRVFLLTSVAGFAGWTLLGCNREMRLELKMRNGPLVWFAFLVFIGLYVAGFDAWLSPDMKSWDAVSLRLLLAMTTFAVLTYLMVLLEPKDRVHYRWMESQFRSGHIVTALSGVQAWMMSYGAAILVGGVLSVWLFHDVSIAATGQALVLATLGFITRDVSIFVLMQTLPGRRRGDLGALVVLFALYVLVPAILNGLHANGSMYLFFPQIPNPTWLGAGVAWAEGLAVAVLALTRLALVERDGTPVAA